MNPNIAIAILLITFVLLIMIKCPITFSMIISTAFTMLYIQVPVMTLVQQMSKQLNSFSLLAIPFFILMGEIMAAGGISSRLLAFANVCVGQITGGLAHVNVLASMLFGGISGSAIADVSSLGALEIPMMEEAGYIAEDGSVIAPADWNEMYEYAKNLTKDGQTGLAIDWGNNMAVKAYDACVMGANGNLYESDGNTLNFTAGPVKNMLQVWQDLVKDGYTTTDVFADADANRTNFKAGRVAMHIAPASRWIEAGELLGAENVGVMPIPGTDTHGSVSYIHGAVIPKASENRELAIKFIKDKLLQEQFQADSMNSYGKMSPMKAHYEKLDNPYWPTVLDFTEKATTPPLYKDYTKLDTNMQIELQKMLSGGSTVDEFSANMSKFMTTIDLSTGMNK